MIFPIKEAQNMVAYPLYERNFDMIFHFMAAQNLVAEHYEIDFDMIFRLNAAHNLVQKTIYIYIIEFYMIFHYKAAQNLVAEHYERDFDLIFRLINSRSKLGCWTLWMRFSTWFSL